MAFSNFFFRQGAYGDGAEFRPWYHKYSCVVPSTRRGEIVDFVRHVLSPLEVVGYSFGDGKARGFDGEHFLYVAVKLESGEVIAVIVTYRTQKIGWRGVFHLWLSPHPESEMAQGRLRHYYFPEKLLGLLTPTDDTAINEWRGHCADRNQSRRDYLVWEREIAAQANMTVTQYRAMERRLQAKANAQVRKAHYV